MLTDEAITLLPGTALAGLARGEILAVVLLWLYRFLSA